MSSDHRVQLYYASGCHLCEEARRVIQTVQDEKSFDFLETDITGDPELESRFRERIPVIFVDGNEAFTYFVHPDGLRRRLDA